MCNLIAKTEDKIRGMQVEDIPEGCLEEVALQLSPEKLNI